MSNENTSSIVQTEKWLMRIALIGMMAFLLLLYFDSWMVPRHSSDENLIKIGYSADVERDVRRRSISEFVWLPLGQGNEVFLGDALFTGSNSRTRIHLDSGIELQMDADSLLVLDKIAELFKLNIRFGNVTGTLGSAAASKLKLSFDNQEIDLDGKQVEFSLQKSNIHDSSLQIIKGDAGLNTKSGKVKITKNQKVELGRSIASIAPVVPVAVAPPPAFLNVEKWSGRREVWLNKKGMLSFSWETSKIVDYTEISVSSSDSFQALAIKETVHAKQFQWQPQVPKGTFFWKLQAFDRDGKFLEESPVSEWVVNTLEAPQWQTTANTLVFSKYDVLDESKGDRLSSRTVSWRSNEKKITFEMEWSRVEDFSLSERVALKSNQWLIPEWPLGRYFIRVRSEALNRPSSPWSTIKVVEFTDKDPEGLLPPTLNQSTIESVTNVGAPELAWGAQPRTHRYVLEVSKDLQFTKITDSLKIEGEIWTGKPKSIGHYFIRVFPLGSKDRRGPASATVDWWVKAQGPEWKMKSSVLAYGATKKGPTDGIFVAPPIKIEWVDQSSTPLQNFILEESLTKEFSSIRNTFAIESKEKELVDYPIGSYFYRVRSNYRNGTESIFSKVLSIEVVDPVKENLQAPQLLVDSINSKKTGEALVTGVLKWKPMDKIAKYRVQLSAMDNFTRLLKEEDIKGASLSLKVRDVASYYLRVAAIGNSGQVGLWSATVPWNVQWGGLQIDPIPNIKVTLKSKTAKLPPTAVKVSWHAPTLLKSFHLEVASDIKFKDMIYETNTEKRSLVVSLPKEGTYWFRVIAIDGDQKNISEPSEVISTKYLINLPMVAPRLISPKDKVSYILSKVKNPQIWVSWVGDDFSSSYSIEFSKSKSFSTILQKFETKEHRMLIDHNSIRGKVFWRVKGINTERGVESSWSEPWSIAIVDIENDD